MHKTYANDTLTQNKTLSLSLSLHFTSVIMRIFQGWIGYSFKSCIGLLKGILNNKIFGNINFFHPFYGNYEEKNFTTSRKITCLIRENFIFIYLYIILPSCFNPTVWFIILVIYLTMILQCLIIFLIFKYE